MRARNKIAELLKKYNQGIKLDIGCADRKQPGWVGIDSTKFPGVDIAHDIETYPWPLPDNCASLALASHVVGHINPVKLGFIRWMDEVWRVLKPLGQFVIATPYGMGQAFCQDPANINPCTEATWYYFDPLHPSGLYKRYRPKPWRIVTNSANLNGNIEVALEKRIPDKSYET